MKKVVYRLKKFRLSEISLVDRPACDLATVERVELAKRTAERTPAASRASTVAGKASSPNAIVGAANRDLSDKVGDGTSDRSGSVEKALSADNDLSDSTDRSSALRSVRLRADDLCKYVPLTAVPLEVGADEIANATSIPSVLTDEASEPDLGRLCDALVCVASNIRKDATIGDKRTAILGAFDEVRKVVEKELEAGNIDRLAAISRWRAGVVKVEQAIASRLRKRALADALCNVGFEWPEGTPAIELIDRQSRPVGRLSLDEFRKRGAALSAANRQSLHQARDILVAMCADAGCAEDQSLVAALADLKRTRSVDQPSEKSLDAGLEAMLGELRRAANTLGAAADEVRKVAEASAGAIRKSEGGAKVLSALTERVARLEAQPDNSRPQPLRTVEKGNTFAFYGAGEDSRARMAELDSEATELRKRGSDPVAQKRLAEIRLEIIRLANGAAPATRL